MKNNYKENIDIERFEYDKKIQDIKKRKRSLKLLIDPDIKKKIRKDLKREQRSAKHGDANIVKKYIREEIEKYGKND